MSTTAATTEPTKVDLARSRRVGTDQHTHGDGVVSARLTDAGFYSPGSWTRDDLLAIAREIDPLVPLDLGIVRAVKILLDAGISTFESCEGGEGHCYPEPTVRFHGGPPRGWQAIGLLKTYDLPVKAVRRTWPFVYGEPTGPYWEVTFRQTLD